MGRVSIECAAVSDRGRIRSSNEDNFAIMKIGPSATLVDSGLSAEALGKDQHPICNSSCDNRDHLGVLLVADGMGGHGNGDLASRIVAQQCIESLKASAADIRAAASDGEFIRSWLEDQLRACHGRLKRESAKRVVPRRMGSTATIALISWPRLFVAHVGDSQCYLLRDGRLTQLTKDHTIAQYLIDRGSLTPSAAQHSDFQHQLWNSLGVTDQQVSVDFHEVYLEPRDTLLLCTDGLSKPLTPQQMTRAMDKDSDVDSICNQLVEAANKAGGPDNITAAVARFVGVNSRLISMEVGSHSMLDLHQVMMEKAISVAMSNRRCPFGALLVDRAANQVIATGFNRTQENPLWHGEIDVINRLADSESSVDWTGLDLYTTAEPCPMCQAAILWARIPRVIYGTSIERLVEIGWNQIVIPSEEVVHRAPFASCEVIGGVLSSECDQLFIEALRS